MNLNPAIADFSSGVTTRKRVRTSDRAVMKHIDGYTGRSGALECIGGVHKVGAAATLNATPKLWGMIKTGTKKALVSPGTTLLQMIDVTAGSPAWQSGPAIATLADDNTTVVSCDGMSIVPTSAGIRRLEPAVALAETWQLTGPGGLSQDYYAGFCVQRSGHFYRCTVAHTPTALLRPFDGTGGWTGYWVELTGMPFLGMPEATGTPALVAAKGWNIDTAGVNTLNRCNVGWTAGLGTGIYVADVWLETTGSVLVTAASVATGQRIAYFTFAGGSEPSLSTEWLVLSIYNPVATAITTTDGRSSGLVLKCYDNDNPGAVGAAANGLALIPVLQPGWNRIVTKLFPLGGSPYTAHSMAIETGDEWQYTGVTKTFNIDLIQKDSVGAYGNWEDISAIPSIYFTSSAHYEYEAYELNTYYYVACLAVPAKRFAPDSGIGQADWVISNPFGAASVAFVGPGDKVTLTMTGQTVPSGYDASDVIFYVRKDGTDAWLYAGKVAYGSLATPGLVHTGGIGDFDESIGLPQYIELTHDTPPAAKFAMAADDCLYLACLGYDANHGWVRKTAIARSTFRAPHYFPRAPQLSTDGNSYDGYAKTGTTIMELITWNGQKIILLDTEMFLMAGNDNNNTQFVYVGPVGCASGKSVAAGRAAVIWHGVDDFYLWDGSSTTNISQDKIDASLVDFTLAHEAVFHGEYYVLYCTYDSSPSLLIFDTLKGGGYIYTLAAAMIGIVEDRATGRLWGVNSAGYPVELWYIDSTDATALQDLKANGTYQNHAFVAETAYGVISAPGYDSKVIKALLDIEATADLTLPVTVTAIGKAATQTDTQNKAIDKDIPEYEIGFPETVSGRVVSVKLAYSGATPHTIHELAGVCTGNAQR